MHLELAGNQEQEGSLPKEAYQKAQESLDARGLHSLSGLVVLLPRIKEKLLKRKVIKTTRPVRIGDDHFTGLTAA